MHLNIKHNTKNCRYKKNVFKNNLNKRFLIDKYKWIIHTIYLHNIVKLIIYSFESFKRVSKINHAWHILCIIIFIEFIA